VDPHPTLSLARGIAVKVLTGCVALLMWLSFMQLPSGPVTNHLDLSWMQAMGHALKHKLQAGVDCLFVYGPLGFFSTHVYDADLFYQKIVWELLTSAAFVVVFLIVTRRLEGRSKRIAFLSILVLLASYQKDSLYLLATVAIAVLCIRNANRGIVGMTAGIAVLSVLSAVKFTLFVMAALSALLIAVSVWRCRSRALGVGVAAVYVVLCFVVWAVAGQSPGNLPRYVTSSLQMIGAYNEAMARYGDPFELMLGLTAVVVTGVLIAVTVLFRPISLRQVLVGVVASISLFLVWKHGFVRHDRGHVLLFFPFPVMLSFLVIPRGVRSKPVRRSVELLLVLSAVTCVTGFFVRLPPADFARTWTGRIRSRAHHLLFPRRFREDLDERLLEHRETYALPTIRGAVGRHTVDLFSYEQGLLFLNDLRYHPRPALQSCTAYTPRMIKEDAKFFMGENAPRFIVFKLQTIDWRYPIMDDSDALRVILQDYIPVLIERRYILFERSPGAGATFLPDGDAVLRKRVRLGQWVAVDSLGGDVQLLTLDVRYSPRGRLRNLLYKPPPVYLEMRAEGRDHAYRMVPRMARSAFILNPMLPGQRELVWWYMGRELKRVGEFRVYVKPKDRTFFRRRLVATVVPCSVTVPSFQRAPRRNRFSFLFDTAPTHVESAHPAKCWYVDGRSVFVVHAPGEMRFRLPPGSHQVMGRYGIVPEAYVEGLTDGVVFSAATVVPGGTETVLFERHLDPRDSVEDRGAQRLSLSFETQRGAELVLRTGTGPVGNDGWDWSYWTELDIITEP
jgi:hypothetical protein